MNIIEMNEVILFEMDEILGDNELFAVFQCVDGDECHLVELSEENDFNFGK